MGVTSETLLLIIVKNPSLLDFQPTSASWIH